MLDKTRLIDLLKNHIESGYDIVEGLKINDENYATIVLNLVQVDRTINQLKQEIEYDKAQDQLSQKDSEDVEVSE